MPVLKGLNMAIYAMLSLQPPLAQVELPQYIDPEAADVTTETPFKATRYIEVPLNLQFAVGCSMVDQSIFTEHNTQAVALDICIDGVQMIKACITNPNVLSLTVRRVYLNDYGERSFQDFQFSDIVSYSDTTPADGSSTAYSISPDLGTITIQVFRLRSVMLITNRGDIAKKTPKYTSRSRPYSTNSIPERALQKKGLTYQAKLGDEYANTGPEYSIQDNDYVDPPYRPYALFTFKYRSRAVLQDLGIIPRTSNPSPPPSPPGGRYRAKFEAKLQRKGWLENKDNEDNKTPASLQPVALSSAVYISSVIQKIPEDPRSESLKQESVEKGVKPSLELDSFRPTAQEPGPSSSAPKANPENEAISAFSITRPRQEKQSPIQTSDIEKYRQGFERKLEAMKARTRPAPSTIPVTRALLEGETISAFAINKPQQEQQKPAESLDNEKLCEAFERKLEAMKARNKASRSKAHAKNADPSRKASSWPY